MTINAFIENAIEGGWTYMGSKTWKARAGRITFYSKENYPFHTSEEKILLDPLAWQAVGKVEGWPEKKEDGFMQPCPNGWLDRMHQMITSLAKGKTIEEFLKTL